MSMHIVTHLFSFATRLLPGPRSLSRCVMLTQITGNNLSLTVNSPAADVSSVLSTYCSVSCQLALFDVCLYKLMYVCEILLFCFALFFLGHSTSFNFRYDGFKNTINWKYQVTHFPLYLIFVMDCTPSHFSASTGGYCIENVQRGMIFNRLKKSHDEVTLSDTSFDIKRFGGVFACPDGAFGIA